MKVAIVTVLLCVCWTHIHAGPVETSVDAVEEVASAGDVEQAGAEALQANPNSRFYNCPNGWIKYETRCFLLVPSTKTWFDAEKFCAEKSARLASVHSAAEWDYLQNLMSFAEIVNVWLGGFWLQGVWGWSDLSPFSFANWYFKSDPSSKSCAMGYSHVGFRNSPCNYAYPFICAKDVWAC